jgi:hypothetical protein
MSSFSQFLGEILFLSFLDAMANSVPWRAALRSGHRIRLRNEKTRVQIPAGYKVFRETQQCCCAQNDLHNMRCLCVERRNKGSGHKKNIKKKNSIPVLETAFEVHANVASR